MKKKIVFGLALVLAVLFVAIPLPGAGITLRLTFDEFEEGDMVLYYSTVEVPVMTPEQSIQGEYDPYRKIMSFRIPAEVAGSVQGIRIDFPEQNGQLVSIEDVTVSSAGVVKKRYIPGDFFQPGYLVAVNDIPAMSNMSAKAREYLQLGESDPYVELLAGFVAEIVSCRSTYRLTRVVMVLLAFAAWWCGSRKVFESKGLTVIEE